MKALDDIAKAAPASSKDIKTGDLLRLMTRATGKHGRDFIDSFNATRLGFGRFWFERGECMVALRDEEHTFGRGSEVSGVVMVQVLTAKGVFWMFVDDVEKADRAERWLGVP